jgi:hypothetical protein
MAVIKIVPMPGAEGQQGEAGAIGPQGPQGETGATGPAGADAVWYYNGAYNAGAAYAVGDIVTYEGQTWYRKNANGGNVGDTPSEGLFWDLIAAKGDNANVADFEFYQPNEGISVMKIHNHDMNIVTTSDVPGTDADITIASADDVWIYGQDTVRVYSQDELQLIGNNYVLLSGQNGEFLNDPTVPSNQIATIGDLIPGIQGEPGPQGEQGIQGEPGEPGSITNLKFGSFFDTTVQTGGSIRPFELNSTDVSNGVSIVDGSHITMQELGIYNIAFSAQLQKTGGSSADIYIWLRHNGVDVPDTATIVHMANNNTFNVAAWNFFVNCNTLPQDFQLMWYTESTSVSIGAISDAVTPVGVPSIPSIILTVNKVGDL